MIGRGVDLAAIEAATGNLLAAATAWTHLLGVHDHDGLAHAEPETLRYRLTHLSSTITHARRRILGIAESLPYADAFVCVSLYDSGANGHDEMARDP